MKKMQTWLIYGILTSIFWGCYILASKVATSEKYFGLKSSHVSLLMLIGIAIVVTANLIYEGKSPFPKSKLGIGFAVLAGILWALGITFSLKALNAGADVSKLTPIYNTNTLIAVILGIILLKEIPAANQMIKVVLGAICIVIGAILVSF